MGQIDKSDRENKIERIRIYNILCSNKAIIKIKTNCKSKFRSGFIKILCELSLI